MKVIQCGKKGCLAYIVYVVTAWKQKKQTPDVSIMKNYSDVLCGDLQGIPCDCQVEFKVDTILREPTVAQ